MTQEGLLPDFETLDRFWAFVAERQAVWHKRFELQLPPPWTRDPVIGGFHFTNIYRDLDTGTQWLKELLKDREAESLTDALWYIISYRLLNRIETFEATQGPCEPDPEELILWHSRLRIHRDNGNAVFTSRHQCKTLSAYEDLTRELLEPDASRPGRRLDAIARDLKASSNGDEAVEVLRTVRWIGEFFANQIYMDLDDSGTLDFSDDGFVPMGPGSRTGLKTLFPNIRPKEMAGAVVALQEHQDVEMDRLGLEFHPYNGMRLRLRDVEHALCEFQKYCMISERRGIRTGSKVMASPDQKWWAGTAEEL